MVNFSMLPTRPLSIDARGTGLGIHLRIWLSNEISSTHWYSLYLFLSPNDVLTTTILGTHHYLDFGIKLPVFLVKIISLLHPHLLISYFKKKMCVYIYISFPLTEVGFGVDTQPSCRWQYMLCVRGNILKTLLGKVSFLNKSTRNTGSCIFCLWCWCMDVWYLEMWYLKLCAQLETNRENSYAEDESGKRNRIWILSDAIKLLYDRILRFHTLRLIIWHFLKLPNCLGYFEFSDELQPKTS